MEGGNEGQDYTSRVNGIWRSVDWILKTGLYPVGLNSNSKSRQWKQLGARF